MSQQQPRRPQQEEGLPHEQPIRYGEVFSVAGDLAAKPITPQDADMMRTAENLVLGQTQKGGPADVMQSAATRNERAGLVGHMDASHLPSDQGVSVTETKLPGRREVTETVAGQVVRKFTTPTSVAVGPSDIGAVTSGKVQKASVASAGDDPIDQSATEVPATGRSVIPGGCSLM